MSEITKEEMLQEIAAIIYYQCSLREQDRWLGKIIDMGMWIPDEEIFNNAE